MMKRKIVKCYAYGLGMMLLILDSKTAFTGAKEGLQNCMQSVVPSLFPFFVLSILLTASLSSVTFPLLGIIGKGFGLTKEGASILIPAFLGGYPTGAQSVEIRYEEGMLSKQDSETLLGFCNQAGPAFLFGMVAPAFSDKRMPWLIWLVQIVGAVCTCSLLPRVHAEEMKGKEISKSLSEAVKQAAQALIGVCGWIVLFRILISFLEKWVLWMLPQWLKILLCGLLELSNGCMMLPYIPSENLRFIFACIMLSFGGICVSLQTNSVCPGLSLRKYFWGKLLQTVLCALFALALVRKAWPAFLFSVGFFIMVVRNQKKHLENKQALVYNGFQTVGG